MYELINAHSAILLDAINLELAIAPYNELMGMIQEVDVSNDKDFRSTYSRYWGLNAARLSADFQDVYFQYLETSKTSPDSVDVQLVATRLLEAPTRNGGRRSLQFSFSSKLVHMLNPHMPVYDSTVERFFFLPGTETLSSHDKKINRLMKSYNFLVREYQRILDEAILSQTIAAFRDRYQDTETWTDVRIIDTLIWQFVSFMRKGDPSSRKILYR